MVEATACRAVLYGFNSHPRLLRTRLTIMGDYLFFSREVVRIQAHTHVRNVAFQKVLEKVGFRKEQLVKVSLPERNMATGSSTIS